jgi:hypothetical protein
VAVDTCRVIGGGDARVPRPVPRTRHDRDVMRAATIGGRLLRAGTVAGLSVGLAVAAHASAHGSAPSVAVTVGAVLLAARCCWGASARRLSAGRLLFVVGSVQVGLHVTFAVTAPPTTAHAGAHAGHRMAGHPAEAGHGGGLMLVAHVLAALVLAGWLHSGERLAWRAARSTVRGARQVFARLWPLRGAVPVGAGTAAPGAAGPRTATPPSLALLGYAVIRRGPPGFARG